MRFLFIVTTLTAIFFGCKDDKSSSGSSGGQTAQTEQNSGETAASLAVSGSLAISENLKSEGVADQVVEGQLVELLDESGQVVGAAKTEAGGTFTVAIDTGAALALQGLESTTDGKPGQSPFLVTLRGIFVVNASGKETAAGLQKSLIIDPGSASIGDDGVGELRSGTHTAQKVGAIYGKITLETVGDPTGTDVYIPGTNYFQKTDSEGKFLLGFLPAGVYTVRADRGGFTSIEWQNINVQRQTTTILDSVTMPIATGPKIEAFDVVTLNTDTGTAALRIKVKAAAKYRISSLEDFGDTTYRPILVTQPEIELSFGFNPSLKVVTIFLEAADNDGLTASKSLTIDREPPTKGSVAIATNAAIVASKTIGLKTSADGASKMRFAESVPDLALATWEPYSSNHTHTLINDADGSKTIFAEFSDDSLNTLGSKGDIFVNFMLDTTAPLNGKILLLPPESPTGAFNTPLAWISELEENVSFEVQVATDTSFTGVIRTMKTPERSILVSPPLDSEGVYNWRVRALDEAGNATEWVDSVTSEKEFRVQVMTKAYHIDGSLDGDSSIDHYLAREVLSVGDLNNDGFPEVAMSVMNTDYVQGNDSCIECGVVRIVDMKTRTTLRTLTEKLPKTSLYGEALALCDVDNDNIDELVVTAPGAQSIVNGVVYNQAGSIYVYEVATGQQIAQRKMNITAGDPSYTQCRTWDAGSNCIEWEWPNWPNNLREVPWGDGRRFGQSVACLRQTGADRLIVGEPKFHNGTIRSGRIHVIEKQGTNLPSTAMIEGVEDAVNFGSSLAFLSAFKLDVDGDTNMECPLGQTIAVGVPDRDAGGYMRGGVIFLQASGATWAECGSISAEATDPNYLRLGAILSPLGDADGDSSTEEIAISSMTWDGGIVRVFGGSNGLIQKSLKVTSNDQFTRMGYFVSLNGDFYGDGKADLIISSPGAKVNGQWQAGIVRVYRWADLDDDDNDGDGDSDAPPFLTIVGKPEGDAATGGVVIPVLASANDKNSQVNGLIISRPGRRLNGEWGVGSIHTYSELRLAPTLPVRTEGLSTGAQLGFSMEAMPDLDQDGVADVLFGQTGGRCAGKPWGATSLYSVLDKVFSLDICSDYSNYEMGKELKFFPRSGYVAFGKRGNLYFSSPWEFVRNTDIANVSQFPSSKIVNDLGWNQSWISNPITGSDTWIDQFLVTDPERWNTAEQQGSVTRYEFNGSKTRLCNYMSDYSGARMGTAAEFLTDIGGLDSSADMAFGMPNEPAGSSTGAVIIVDGTVGIGACQGNADLTINGASPLVLKKISADDPAIISVLGAPAISGFGSLVVPLGDLDGAGDGVEFLFVSNTNMHHGTSALVPEFFVIKLNGTLDPTIIHHDTGVAGGMLGGSVRLLADINGDGMSEVAVSYPGGVGRLGFTGQIRVYSSAGFLTADPSDDIIQKLYNPDPNPSQFGQSVMYSDISGDGIPDFVVTASSYDSAAFQNAGAFYVYQVEPIVD